MTRSSKDEYNLSLYPVIEAEGVFVEHSSRDLKCPRCEIELPCGRVVHLDVGWYWFPFPFFGCHDFCPFGNILEDCEIFQKAYAELSKAEAEARFG